MNKKWNEQSEKFDSKRQFIDCTLKEWAEIKKNPDVLTKYMTTTTPLLKNIKPVNSFFKSLSASSDTKKDNKPFPVSDTSLNAEPSTSASPIFKHSTNVANVPTDKIDRETFLCSKEINLIEIFLKDIGVKPESTFLSPDVF